MLRKQAKKAVSTKMLTIQAQMLHSKAGSCIHLCLTGTHGSFPEAHKAQLQCSDPGVSCRSAEDLNS